MLEAFPEVKRKVLGLTPEAGPVLAEGVVLNKAGVNQHTKRDKDSSATLTSFTNNKSAEGILARLKRDHPQIAQAFIDNEPASQRAVAKVVGCDVMLVNRAVQTNSSGGKSLHPAPSFALVKAQAAFRRLTTEDRNAFCSWLAEQSQ